MSAHPDVVHGSGAVALARHHALRLVNVIVLAILVALLYRQVDVSELRHAVREADLRYVAAAFALNLATGALFVVRSHLVLVSMGHRVERRVLVPAILLGNVAGSLTPASTGELLRTTALRGHARIPTTDGVALVLFERGMSVYLMAVTTGVAAAFVALPLNIALVVTAAAAPLLIAPAFGGRLLRMLPAAGDGASASRTGRALAHVSDAADRIRSILEDRRLLATWSVLTVATLALSALQVWLLARSVADAVNPEQAWVAFGGSQLAGMASLLPFGVGALDGSLAAILRKFGMTLEQGAGAAVLLRLVITIPYGIAAIACYLYLQRAGTTGERSAT